MPSSLVVICPDRKQGGQHSASVDECSTLDAGAASTWHLVDKVADSTPLRTKFGSMIESGESERERTIAIFVLQWEKGQLGHDVEYYLNSQTGRKLL